MFYAITDRLPSHTPKRVGSWLLAMWRAASNQLRARVVVVTALLVAHAGMLVNASEGVGGMSDWFQPQTILALASVAVTAGVLIQDLAAVKKRVSQCEDIFARKAEVELQLLNIQGQLKTIHEDLARNETGKRLAEFVTRFEAYLQTVQAWSTRIESEIHTVQLDITRIEARSAPKWPSA